ncbi:MAG: IS30 family transposase [Desulforhopalus sp.]|nr:IS30 family transposase [Desulforhopalus sp.]
MSYTHLIQRERICLFYLLQLGLSLREIGRRLNRSHTTIAREIKRNKRVFGCYCDRAAHSYAHKRKSIPRHMRRKTNKQLYRYVIERLQFGWSPEIISQRIQRDFPHRKKKMRISHETIYQWIYQDAVHGGSLFCYLIRRHRKRKKQRGYGSLRGLIPNRVDISLRPEVVAKRSRYGDWEGDTMVGYRHRGRLVTHVERRSRYLLACKVKDGTASSFNDASLLLFHDIPREYCKTLTLDNGSENAKFSELEDKLSMQVYFAKPYASWERGTNENTNGLLRRFFPKGTDFLKVSDFKLAKVVKMLNHRPRKCLNYRTPYEVFNSVSGGALGI